MKYRSFEEIIVSMLKSAQSPTTKTRIMYDSYTSYSMVNAKLEYMLKHELIEKTTQRDKNKKSYLKSQNYIITSRGRTYIHKFEERKKFLEDELK